MGLNFLNLKDYIYVTKYRLKNIVFKPKIKKLKLDVNQKTILHLERQRQLKIEGDAEANNLSMHNIRINHNNNKLKAKIRIKGDRAVHWINKKTSSYKIDMRGNDRIWGLEEFTIQKPIARNYTYEFLFHRF